MEVYIGTITKLLGEEDGKDPDLYQVEVDIPERGKGFKAFPLRGEVDEPRVGDVVVLRELDPKYHSYFLYEKLKENGFIGIRARGKKIKITQDEIEIGVYKDDDSWYDTNDETEEPALDCFASIKITDSGEVIIKANKISLEGENLSMKGGTLTLGAGAKALPSSKGGPFWCGGPIAPKAGTPMISGNTIKVGK
jgi:hypothetical protein